MKTIILPVLATLAGLLRSCAARWRAAGVTTVAQNESLTSPNKPED